MWFSVEMMLEVIVCLRLKGLLMVIMKLFILRLVELVIWIGVRFLVFFSFNIVRFIFLFRFINFVDSLWLLIRVILILFVLCVIWVLVSM